MTYYVDKLWLPIFMAAVAFGFLLAIVTETTRARYFHETGTKPPRLWFHSWKLHWTTEDVRQFNRWRRETGCGWQITLQRILYVAIAFVFVWRL